jgi:hypothetical protein
VASATKIIIVANNIKDLIGINIEEFVNQLSKK